MISGAAPFYTISFFQRDQLLHGRFLQPLGMLM
jgi:hypothetical protein